MAEVRYVTVPATVAIKLKSQTNETVELPFPFEEFLNERTSDAGVFGADLDGIMLGLEARQSFKGAEPGAVIGVKLAVWEALCKAIRKPQGGYNPTVMIQLVDYAHAVLDAPSKLPVVVVAELSRA